MATQWKAALVYCAIIIPKFGRSYRLCRLQGHHCETFAAAYCMSTPSPVVWSLQHLFQLTGSGNQLVGKKFPCSRHWAMAKMLQPAAPSRWVVICPLTSLTTILTAADLQKQLPTHTCRNTRNTHTNRAYWPVSVTAPLSNQILCHMSD